jgi:co-chaperonin GroES (HSP10)
MKSKFLEAFKALSEEGKDLFQINGDTIFIEEIPWEEKTTKSGLVLAGSKRNHDGFDQNRPTLAHVLAVGPGWYNDKGEDVPCNVRPGDIILINSLVVSWLSYFGPLISIEGGARIGRTRDQDVQFFFRGADGYQKAYAIMDKIINKEGNAA